jgi:hypothetical protein
VVLAHLQRRRGFERKRKRSLEVTGHWPQGHLHVRSVKRWRARLARLHRRVRSPFGTHRTQSTRHRGITVDRPVTLAWQRVARSGRTERWPASGRGTPDAFDHEMEALGVLCCALDAETRCVRCGTVGARSDRWRSAAKVERTRTRGRRWCIRRWLPASGGTHQCVQWC